MWRLCRICQVIFGTQMPSPNHKRELLTLEQIIEVLRTSAGILTIAAQKLTINRNTLREWINAEPNLKDVLDEIREINLDLSEAGLMKHIQEGNLDAIKFYLRTMGKHRGWIESARLEGQATLTIEGPDNARERILQRIAQMTIGEDNGEEATLN
jgi:hypothetical protein